MNSELIQLYSFLEKLEGSSSLLEHISVYNDGLEAPYHLKPLADAFWRILQGEPVHVLCSVPPGHGKSLSLSNWCAKYLHEHPTHTIAYITYSQKLALKQSRICQEMVLKLGHKLKRGAESLQGWLLDEGGGFVCSGRGGTITGFHFNVIIVDDSLANREEAESHVIKDGLEDWFTSTVYSRLKKDGAIIVNGTRWASDDLIGRLIDKDDEAQAEGKARTWEIINLPAINSKGEALWPALYPVEVLAKKRKVLGEYDWASLYQGSPNPRGSMLFHEPTNDNYYSIPSLQNARIVIGVDPAASSKNHADYSVICVASTYGKDENQVTEILDMWYGQIEIPELVEKIHEYSTNWGARVIVESVGGFKGVAQMLRRIDRNIPVIETTPTTDKYTRAIPLIAAWNDGRVKLPSDVQWTRRLLKELKAFTATGSTTTDDMIDAMNIAWSALNLPDGIRKGVHSLRTK